GRQRIGCQYRAFRSVVYLRILRSLFDVGRRDPAVRDRQNSAVARNLDDNHNVLHAVGRARGRIEVAAENCLDAPPVLRAAWEPGPDARSARSNTDPAYHRRWSWSPIGSTHLR